MMINVKGRIRKLAIIAFCLGVILSAQSKANEEPTPNKTDEKAAKTQDVTVSSPVVVKIDTPEKSAETVARETEDRYEHLQFDRDYIDLTRSIKYATWWLVVMAGIQALVYGIQIGYLKLTLDHARVSSEKQLRAYVGINHPGQPGPHNSPPQYFRIEVENGGQTPGREVEAAFGWWWFDGPDVVWPESKSFELQAEKIGSNFTLPTGAKRTIDFPLERATDGQGTLFADILAKANRSEITLYIYGTVSYRDVFDHTPVRHTHFCVRHVPDALVMYGRKAVVWKMHNDAD